MSSNESADHIVLRNDGLTTNCLVKSFGMLNDRFAANYKIQLSLFQKRIEADHLQCADGSNFGLCEVFLLLG
jgi:hypothetical protein